MPLSDVVHSRVYNSSTDIIPSEILKKCLENAVSYDRGIGFFSAEWLKDAATGMIAFADKGGKARWIITPEISQGELEAIVTGENAKKDELLKDALLKKIKDLRSAIQEDILIALAWLVADGIIDIKIAIPTEKKYFGHSNEKFGTFKDENDNVISFESSENDTAYGNNYQESIKAFCEWTGEPMKSMSIDIKTKFERLWNNKDSNRKILPLAAEIKEEIIKLRKDKNRPYKKSLSTNSTPTVERLKKPSTLNLRGYQNQAIDGWFGSRNKPQNADTPRGILAMCTGSGKTKTALSIAAEVSLQSEKGMVFIIICPFLSLCEQWKDEVEAFGIKPVTCYAGYDNWGQNLDMAFEKLEFGITRDIVVIVSNGTFITERFQRRIHLSTKSNNRYNHMLIADEMHNLGSEKIKTLLPTNIKLRLGLSATPDRHSDEEGTQELYDYFGDIVFTFTLEEGIKQNCLTPYEYYPIIVKLTPEESSEYARLSAAIGVEVARHNGEYTILAKNLGSQRARLIGSASNKIVELHKLLSQLPNNKLRRSLFYCGDGREFNTRNENEESLRQIEAVVELLGNQYNIRVAKFTYNEGETERKRILEMIKSGDIDAVVAIKCLDEGIDVPALESGFILASSKNPRQFIQRRGRLLRKADNKEKAIIYDFVVVPDIDEETSTLSFDQERRLIKQELQRINEFCRTAINHQQAAGTMLQLRIKYNLLSQI